MSPPAGRHKRLNKVLAFLDFESPLWVRLLRGRGLLMLPEGHRQRMFDHAVNATSSAERSAW